jgi:cell wall-associated NlpC family hydrolase
LIRAGLAAALSLALGACASASHQSVSRPDTAAAAVVPGAIARPETRTLFVENALSMLGQPYRFGGAAPGGFDCSGLIFFAADGAGFRVPRTAHEQQTIGMPVARSELQAGDLVFMHLAHKELHVGIAIDHVRFVHAPSTGGYVRIDSLVAPPYRRGFVGARRLMTPPPR